MCVKVIPSQRWDVFETRCMSAYYCAQLSYTTQHRTVLIIFHLMLQTVIIAQMLSIGGERERETTNLRQVGLTAVGLLGAGWCVTWRDSCRQIRPGWVASVSYRPQKRGNRGRYHAKNVWCFHVQMASTNKATTASARPMSLIDSYTTYTVSQKRCHPNHGDNFVNSWCICEILSLLQRAVNFQQNQ